MDFKKLGNNVKVILSKLKYRFIFDSEQLAPDKSEMYYAVSVNDDVTGECFFMYLNELDTSHADEEFDWLKKEPNLKCCIFIENTSEAEYILLQFLKEYFKLYPNDYLWNDYKWCYTSEDIFKVAQRKFDRHWCYKDPKGMQ